MKFVLTSSGMQEILPDIGSAVKEQVKEALKSSMKELGNWLMEQINEGWTWIVNDASGPVCLFIAMVFLLFAMFGSKRGAKGVYWTTATYIIIQILGIAIRGF